MVVLYDIGAAPEADSEVPRVVDCATTHRAAGLIRSLRCDGDPGEVDGAGPAYVVDNAVFYPVARAGGLDTPGTGIGDIEPHQQVVIAGYPCHGCAETLLPGHGFPEHGRAGREADVALLDYAALCGIEPDRASETLKSLYLLKYYRLEPR